ncbi:uncharacterized protein LOC132181674 [Corylus avellana]|uniref:uncharacterized protein LOC132181674 n=1 Tax=Corylus avellana TaxID=13451 RepID=UPI00286A869D|nr:uncharacterized protein LOC132181674 [Corylus avellana]
MDENTCWWNIPLIEEIFLKVEVKVICSMVICPGGQQDEMIWAGTKHGLFTVSSAYHLAKSLAEEGKGSCSSEEGYGDVWRKIWAMKSPRVEQLFIWKACQNVLPTKGNLYRRRITGDPLCPLCEREEETPGHILWGCPSAQDVWLECSRSFEKNNSDEADFLHLFELLLGKLEEKEVQPFVAVARQLWYRRNSVVFEGVMHSPAAVIQRARDQLHAFEKMEQTHEKGTNTTIPDQLVTHWKKPPEGYVKLN